MLNPKLGELNDCEDVPHLRTRLNAAGHALYGPYERCEPGHYVVEFSIALAEDSVGEDSVCAFIDVSADHGRTVLAYRPIWISELAGGMQRLRLSFDVEQARVLEYRVYAFGIVSLLIAEQTIVRQRAGKELPGAPPDLQGKIPFVRLNGINIRAAIYDDVHFVEEIFYRKAYNVLNRAETCFIDVGMNVGLTSLWFARMANVQEVHAFEPFPETYARALANLRLNPELAEKVRPYNYGLSDQDKEITLAMNEAGDSGCQSLYNQQGDGSVLLKVRDAASVLGPIIAAAEANGRQIIAKIDCEGSEFDVFPSLARAGLFEKITALLVEWHRLFPGRTQDELFAPLLEAGFLVIDISPDHGNGFFYAVRPATASAKPASAGTGLLRRLFLTAAASRQ